MRSATTKAASPTLPFAPVALVFVGTVLLQGFHELEHVVQVFQRFVFDNPKGAGILGTWLDIEPVHVGYNAGFLLLLGLCYWLGGFLSREARPSPAGFWLMTFALLFQSYHLGEQLFKITQFVMSGMNGTPGILGHNFNLVWLHFTYNTLVYVPFLLAFYLGGFYRGGIAPLSLVWRSKARQAE